MGESIFSLCIFYLHCTFLYAADLSQLENSIECVSGIQSACDGANCMVSQGRIQVFSMGGGGVDYNNRASNYTLIYFKLSYVCPKTWRRKDEGWLAPQGFCDPRISIFFWASCTYFRLFFHVLHFLVGCSKGGVGGLATQSTPTRSAPVSFSSFSSRFL